MSSEYPSLFHFSEGYLRLPVWGHIPLDSRLRSVISHPLFFRLRGIRQLSFVEYIFPGATHTRLEHSIGVFHLTRQVMQTLVQNPASESGRDLLTDETIRMLLAGALLHDMGHYPHAHLLENLKLSSQDRDGFIHHQEMAEDLLFEKRDGVSLADVLETEWQVDPKRVLSVIRGDKKMEPLGKILSGNLDPDKMDYLVRDAHHCAVPYASVDTARLIESFVFDKERSRLAITNKGIASFESLVFSKYMMTRHIYWHHTVKTFGAMMKRLVQDLMDDHILDPVTLKNLFYQSGDEQLLFRLRAETEKTGFPSLELLDGIIDRKPYKKLAVFGFTRETPNPDPDRLIQVPKGVMDHLASRFGKDLKTQDPVILAVNRLFHDPIFRKETEIDLAEKLNRKTNHRYRIRPHEVLIDSPGFHSVFEYADLMELQVYSVRDHTFRPLYHNHLTLFQPEFISGFEAFSKELQILVHPRLSHLSGELNLALSDFIG